MNKAFTLVELAIVIVIIGLLVGGVLAGQELVKQARIRGAIKEFTGYETAVITFKGKYGFLPGDLPNAEQLLGYTCATPPSTRGDGRVQYLSSNLCGPEQTELWRHLSLAKLIKGSYPGWCVNGGCSILLNNYFPPSTSVKNSFFHIQYNSNGAGATSVYSNNGNFLIFSGVRQEPVAAWQIFATLFSQVDAKQIEDKFDDGNPSTGRLFASKGLYYADGTSTSSSTICVNGSNQFYDLSSDTPECMLLYKVD